MEYYRTVVCPKCKTELGIKKVGKAFLPYNSTETAECPVCNETVFRHNTRGEDFEVDILSKENTIEPYKSQSQK